MIGPQARYGRLRDITLSPGFTSRILHLKQVAILGPYTICNGIEMAQWGGGSVISLNTSFLSRQLLLYLCSLIFCHHRLVKLAHRRLQYGRADSHKNRPCMCVCVNLFVSVSVWVCVWVRVCIFMYVLLLCMYVFICIYIWFMINCVCEIDMQKHVSLLVVKKRNRNTMSATKVLDSLL